MGFTKLDAGILQSSIMSAPSSVFKIWIAILASTGPDGIARVSSTFLSASCYMPISTVDKALGVLQSPDARSRSLNDDGRRIERVDGGYRVINYEKYRAFYPQEGDPNSPGAIRTRRWREKTENVTAPPVVTHGDVTGVTSASASASVSASPSASVIEKNLNPIDVALVQLLIDLMQRNNPDSSILRHLTEPRQAEWINQCRLLREVDKRSEAEIERVIRFSQGDSFWKQNILSMPKLREKWDQLWMKAGRGGAGVSADAWVQGMEKRMEKNDGKI